MLIKVLTFIAISMVITGAIALGLILSQRPEGRVSGTGGLSFDDQLARSVTPIATETAELRDGTTALVRHVAGPEGAPLVVLVHGSGWDGGQFDALTAELGKVAHVIAPDLRGHGAAPDRRGDVDYVGQMEDDLADLIEAYKSNENQRVIVIGHSSGGGLVIRFANGAHGALMDAAVLLAPFVQYDAPMMRANSGGWAQTLTRRIVGLSMLNMAGITALDHLTVIEFKMPQEVLDGPQGHRATTAYSWRLNKGYAPRRDWRADVAALPPFTVIAGTEDEAFVATGYEPEFTKYTSEGSYHLIEGVGHLGIVDDPRTLERIKEVIVGE